MKLTKFVHQDLEPSPGTDADIQRQLITSFDEDALKAKFASLLLEEKKKLAAFLYCVLPLPKIAELAKRDADWVLLAAEKYKDQTYYAKRARLEAVAELSHRKAVELLTSIKVEGIPDEKKPRSVRELMESADIADITGRMDRARDTGEDTAELILRVKHSVSSNRKDCEWLKNKKDIVTEIEATEITANGGK